MRAPAAMLRLAGALLAALLLASCDGDAMRLAREARDILDLYERELERKLGAEQAAYTRQAQIEAEASREQAWSNLEQERIERARGLALDLIEGKRPVSRWREPVRDYARADFAVHRDFLLADLDSHSRYLLKIQALQVDKQKVAGLRSAFDALSTKPKLTEQLEALGTLGRDVKADFDRRVCESLALQVKEKQKEAAAAPPETKKQAQAALAALEELRAEKDCR